MAHLFAQQVDTSASKHNLNYFEALQTPLDSTFPEVLIGIKAGAMIWLNLASSLMYTPIPISFLY